MNTFKYLFSNILIAFFGGAFFLFIQSCSNGDSSNTVSAQTLSKSTSKPEQKLTYNFYIDISGSMKIFTPGNYSTDYQKCISSLVQHFCVPSENNTYNFYAFNNRTYFAGSCKSQDDIDVIVKNINSGIKLGKPGATINYLCNYIDGLTKNSVSIIISDFNFTNSPVDKGNFKDQLNSHLRNKLKEFEFSSLLLKLHSGKAQPYFIMILGNESKLSDILFFLQHNNFDKLGFDDYYVLSNPEKHIPARLNRNTECYNINSRPEDFIIEDARCDESTKLFKISFRIKMDNLPFEPSYLTNPNNYGISLGYDKPDIQPLPGDPDFSYKITITSNKVQKGILNISLLNHLPNSFVTSNNKDNDIPILVDALTAAYKDKFPLLGAQSIFRSNFYFAKLIKIKSNL